MIFMSLAALSFGTQSAKDVEILQKHCAIWIARLAPLTTLARVSSHGAVRLCKVGEMCIAWRQLLALHTKLAEPSGYMQRASQVLIKHNTVQFKRLKASKVASRHCNLPSM